MYNNIYNYYTEFYNANKLKIASQNNHNINVWEFQIGSHQLMLI